MTSFHSLSAAGFAATAITFGPARMGFGLFLPEFREAFRLDSGTAGVISGLGFLGFLLGLIAAYALTARHGPRLPVVLGLSTAALGSALVAVAPGVPTLTAGTALAMASAGFAWSPYNNAVHREVEDGLRPRALSIVSTGTALGVAAAGAVALALAFGALPWRVGWAAFAGAAALAALANHAALGPLAGGPGPARHHPWRILLARPAWPLYGVALSFGITTAIYISFAADRVAGAGGLPGLPVAAAPALVFLAYGAFGLVGLATGRVRDAIGLTALLRGLLAASALSHALVALAPTAWGSVLLSAGVQGAFVMMASAVFSFWSDRLFPDLPALSFTAALLAVAAGSVAGPLAAGYLSDAVGAEATFLAAAALSATTAAALLPGPVRERAAHA